MDSAPGGHGLEGIDPGDLGDTLDQIAREHDPDQPLPLERRDEGWCGHERAYIDAGLRRLTCKECGCDLDPFDFLLRLSHNTARFVKARREAEQRARAAHGRLEDLLRQERNAKARLRRIEQRPNMLKPPDE